MTTFTANQAGTGFKHGPGIGWHNLLVPVRGTIEVTAAPVASDVYEMCYTPGHFLCVGGWFAADDLDNGTPETLDLDLGWTDNGDAATVSKLFEGIEWTNDASSDSAAGLLNMGTLTGDAVTGVKAAGSVYRPIILPQWKFFSAPTLIQVTCNTGPDNFPSGGGWMSVVLQGLIVGS